MCLKFQQQKKLAPHQINRLALKHTSILPHYSIEVQEVHHKVGLGETPCHLIRKRCQYYSVEKFYNAFDTALDLIQTKPF